MILKKTSIEVPVDNYVLLQRTNLVVGLFSASTVKTLSFAIVAWSLCILHLNMKLCNSDDNSSDRYLVPSLGAYHY